MLFMPSDKNGNPVRKPEWGKYLDKKGILAVLAVALFLAGYFSGRISWSVGNDSQDKEIRQSGGYSFISPLLECESSDSSPVLRSSELKMKSAIQQGIIDKHPDTSIAVYYRDLNNGPSFGINEQTGYSPASLLKVPLMIAYYKYAEHNPDIMGKQLLAGQSISELSQDIPPEQRVQPGKSYTVSELIERMIRYSDNDATNLLFQNINQTDFGSVFADLGIDMPDIYNANNSMTVKDYASFFRILYNASYLNRDSSEQALQLLSTVDYKDALVAGVPQGTAVSHKFGERESRGDDGQAVRQLHDCGIVYHPSRPYLVCVMTKGSSFKDLSGVVSSISRIIYQQVDKDTR